MFDIITFELQNSTVSSVPHSLGAVPQLMFVKEYSDSQSWYVYSSDLGASKYLLLDTGQGQLNATPNPFGSTAPTTTHASFYGFGAALNVAYLFASLSGISKVDTYTGSSSDVDVNCGFTAGARFVLIKRIDAAASFFTENGSWHAFSSVRGINSNGNDPYVLLDEAEPEVTNQNYLDALSTGFTVKSVSNGGTSELNAAGGTYLFLAIA